MTRIKNYVHPTIYIESNIKLLKMMFEKEMGLKKIKYQIKPHILSLHLFYLIFYRVILYNYSRYEE